MHWELIRGGAENQNTFVTGWVPTLRINDLLQPFWQGLAKRFCTKVCNDIQAAALKATLELGARCPKQAQVPQGQSLSSNLCPPDSGRLKWCLTFDPQMEDPLPLFTLRVRGKEGKRGRGGEGKRGEERKRVNAERGRGEDAERGRRGEGKRGRGGEGTRGRGEEGERGGCDKRFWPSHVCP